MRVVPPTTAVVAQSALLRQPPPNDNDCTPLCLQDGVGFLHISLWDFGPTSVHSVTLVSGPCTPPMAAMYSDPTVLLSTAVAASNGSCAISAGANNHTLIPALLREASIPTSQPLLVLLAANVSLGAGLTHGAILVCRPVILVGLYTRRTSVDFGMVINQLVSSAMVTQQSKPH